MGDVAVWTKEFRGVMGALATCVMKAPHHQVHWYATSDEAPRTSTRTTIETVMEDVAPGIRVVNIKAVS